MDIPAKKILELIAAAHAMTEKLPEAEQYIHAKDIACTLQMLIDEEVEALDEWADGVERVDAMVIAHEDEMWFKAERSESAIRRKLWYVEGI
jgi:hypothetical protein